MFAISVLSGFTTQHHMFFLYICPLDQNLPTNKNVSKLFPLMFLYMPLYLLHYERLRTYSVNIND